MATIPFAFAPLGTSGSRVVGLYIDEDGVLRGKLFSVRDALSIDPALDGTQVTDASYMFYDNQAVTSWSIDLPNATTATSMFSGSALTSFAVDMPDGLTEADGMFSNCELDETSAVRVLTTLPTYTEGTHNLNIGKNTKWFYNEDVIEMLGDTTAGDKSYNGWTVTVEEGNPPVDGMYIDENGELCGRFFNLKEQGAIQGIAADADFSTLTDGTALFEMVDGIQSFSGDLSNLEYGDRMFYYAGMGGIGGFSSFSAGTDGLESLQSGEDMFYGCRLNATSALHIVDTIPTYESGTHLLHLGENSNFSDSQELATLLGTARPIQNGTYSCKGWTITVGY